MTKSRTEEIERLSANNTFDFAFNKLLTSRNDYAEKVTFSVIEPQAPVTLYGARFVANNKSIVLLSAVSDKDRIDGKTNIGTTPLPVALKRIRQIQAEGREEIYLLPLAESHTTYGFKRQHWTVLLIENNDCYFFDPCSDKWWKPSEISASAVYSLEPLKAFLQDAQFNLSPNNITYLAWQKDDYNCGRFCSDIIGKIGGMYFATRRVTTINDDLSKLAKFPTAEEVEIEYSQCAAAQAIIGNKAICDARAQEFLQPKLYRRDLGNFPTENLMLQVATKNKFFEKGEGGSVQVMKDFERNLFTIQGLNYANFFPEKLDVKIKEETLNLLLQAKLNWKRSDINKFIAAHSQGPSAFLLFVLFAGLKKTESFAIQIGQPVAEDMRIDYFQDDNKNLKLSCEYQKFPLIAQDTTTLAYLVGAVKVTYAYKQKAGVHGWELQTVETQNQDILRMIIGMLLPEQYLISQYCPQASIKTVTPPSNLLINSQHFAAEPNLLKADNQDQKIEVAFDTQHYAQPIQEQKEAQEDAPITVLTSIILEMPDHDVVLEVKEEMPVEELAMPTLTKHNQAVYSYVAAALLSIGLSTFSGLITLGTLSIPVLATIPILGWGIASSVCLILAAILTIKSIMNVIINNRAPITQPQLKGLEKNITRPTEQLVVKVDFTATNSPRQNHGFLSDNLAIQPDDTTPAPSNSLTTRLL